MPKLPVVSGADAVRALERLDFVEVTATRKSHYSPQGIRWLRRAQSS